jgi:rifampin ADP-ribosylating transferase
MTEETSRFFHGGPRGLRVGEYILPPSETGNRGLHDYGTGKVARFDRVYLTSNSLAARFFAALYPTSRGGCVYEVEPAGELVDDPDCTMGGLSFECERARIVAVLPLSSSAVRRIRAQVAHLNERSA